MTRMHQTHESRQILRLAAFTLALVYSFGQDLRATPHAERLSIWDQLVVLIDDSSVSIRITSM